MFFHDGHEPTSSRRIEISRKNISPILITFIFAQRLIDPTPLLIIKI